MNDIVIFEIPVFFSKEFKEDIIDFIDYNSLVCIVKNDRIYFSNEDDYNSFFSYLIDRSYGKSDNR